MQSKDSELTALMISPDRQLAEQFIQTLPETRAFQILADLRSYPPQQTLDIRLRQLKPDVVLLDVASSLETAGELIRFLSSFRPATQVIGLHTNNDSDAIVRALRLGASEFLSAPFEAGVQQEAVARIRRLRLPDPASEPEVGNVVVFTSTKPGSGASTLATQTAFALRRRTGRRILLADLDLAGGSIAFNLKLHHGASLVDAMERTDRLDATMWAALAANVGGVDVLPAPEVPLAKQLEPNRLHDVLDYTRMLYDWVILDAPAIPHRMSLLAVSESDKAFLVSTSELASLHLTRKAVSILEQLGFGKDRFWVLVNRAGRRDEIGEADFEKIFNCPVYATFSNDYFALHRATSLGQPLAADCELGKAVEGLAVRLSGKLPGDKRRAGASPALSQT